MDDEQGSNEMPPDAKIFLARHRPAGNRLGSAGRDNEEDGENDDGDDDSEANDQREADGKLRVEVLEADGDPNVAIAADPEVLAPNAQLFAPCLVAEGVRHPPVLTRAQIDRHALDQHVNYAPWCSHCMQASALIRKHPIVIGEFLSAPTKSAYCWFGS